MAAQAAHRCGAARTSARQSAGPLGQTVARSDGLAHALREGWRWCRFHEFLESRHRAAADMQECDYSMPRMQHVRKIFYDSTGPLRAVLLGAVLTPACASKWRHPPPNRHHQEGLCFVCEASFGSFQHIFWECPCRPEGFTRDPPEDPLQRRFGWPLGSTRQDSQVLQHMSTICELIWANRWGRVGQHSQEPQGSPAQTA